MLGFNTPIGGAFSPDMYLCCDLLCIQNKESFPWNYLTFIINLMVTVRKTRSLFNLKEIYKNFDFFPKFKLYLGHISKCLCVFQQIVFVYLYMKNNYNFFKRCKTLFVFVFVFFSTENPVHYTFDWFELKSIVLLNETV